jgi:hypothetical protein
VVFLPFLAGLLVGAGESPETSRSDPLDLVSRIVFLVL